MRIQNKISNIKEQIERWIEETIIMLNFKTLIINLTLKMSLFGLAILIINVVRRVDFIQRNVP